MQNLRAGSSGRLLRLFLPLGYFGKLIGVFPIQNVRDIGRNPNLEFRWCSLAFLYSVLFTPALLTFHILMIFKFDNRNQYQNDTDQGIIQPQIPLADELADQISVWTSTGWVICIYFSLIWNARKFPHFFNGLHVYLKRRETDECAYRRCRNCILILAVSIVLVFIFFLSSFVFSLLRVKSFSLSELVIIFVTFLHSYVYYVIPYIPEFQCVYLCVLLAELLRCEASDILEGLKTAGRSKDVSHHTRLFRGASNSLHISILK